MKTLLTRTLFTLIGLIVLVPLFYGEEDWRGKSAWDKCKAEFEAKGFVTDWDKFISPPVPDDQNFFKAPKMTDWFIKGQHGGDFATQLQNSNTFLTNLTAAAADNYLAWSDQFQPQFELLREALKRPDARMDGDYSEPAEQPIPNFIAVRALVQVLEQRAKCDLQLGRPEAALAELTLLNGSRRLLEAAPTGKPMTLVAAMINVAVTGPYVDAIADGMRSHAWQEPQLAALQAQLAEINLTPFVVEALREAPVMTCREVENSTYVKFLNLTGSTRVKWSDRIRDWLWPRGWTYQNMVNVMRLELNPLDGFDLAHDMIAPRVFDQYAHSLNQFFARKSPYKWLAAIAIPNVTKAEQVTAHHQTTVNEAQIACALERYRLANGSYPGSLEALTPQFIEKLPHDLIGAEPLIYRATADGKFLLYSVGWNEKDDGGQESPPAKNGGIDYSQGDWVWQ